MVRALLHVADVWSIGTDFGRDKPGAGALGAKHVARIGNRSGNPGHIVLFYAV
jgi:hypothetical protein